MTIVTHAFDYQADNMLFKGKVAFDKSFSDKRPLVLVAHDWSGCNQFSEQKAHDLASLGFVGCAIDMFGNGQIGKTIEEKSALIQPLKDDRGLLLKRIKAAYDAACQLPYVNTQKVAAIGFCFGGMCVLDLARSGLSLNGVVSFHGLLMPSDLKPAHIHAKVLVLHGCDDPMVKSDAVIGFSDEMTKAKADWQLHMYGNTMHAFMNPEAHDTTLGTVYNEKTSQRAWQSMLNFFDEVF